MAAQSLAVMGVGRRVNRSLLKEWPHLLVNVVPVKQVVQLLSVRLCVEVRDLGCQQWRYVAKNCQDGRQVKAIAN